MANEADLGNAAADLYLETAIENARLKAATPPRTGLCLNCSEPVEGAYCDSECRRDHEKRKRMKG